MNAPHSLLLIPNHSTLVEQGGARLESAEADLLRSTRLQFRTAGIAAFVARDANTSMSGVIAMSEARVHRLNALEHCGSWRKLLNYLAAAARLPFIVRRYELLYIFCPGYCGALAALWARALGKPYGLYVRCTWLNHRAATGFWWARIFAGASFMIVTGEAFRRRLARYCPNVVNEVPLTALRPADVQPTSLERPGPHRLLFAGRLTRSKGIYDVLHALAILRRAGAAVELTIAGGGVADEVRELTSLCDELAIRPAVTILGHVSHAALAENYRNHSIFVFPSYFTEGFPRVLYEAMMFSLAIVTCDMPGTEGFLIDGVNCLHCRPSDPEQLAACLRRLLEDPQLGRVLAGRGRADVERLYATFTDTSHAQQLLRLACTA
jgi:glycosyltransferase involved in cell wall biosynthesis